MQPLDMKKYSVFANSKAGMQDIDKDKINQVIYTASKDSSFFANELRKSTKVEKKVEEMHNRLREMQPSTKLSAQIHSKMKSKINNIEAARDLTRVWVCTDLDMFFCAVEMRDNPNLVGKPLAVGSLSMICTSNYEARKFGVRSAMPGFIGKKLCPELIIVGPNFEK